ncbi:MAG TPA: DsrE family protein, partial [Casimicrobiaceae bacterium]|nr:DsrE family protein [Casimicrobiaceae bacterium]
EMDEKTPPRRAAITALATGLAAGALASGVRAADAPRRDRVVMQVSQADNARWELALNNAENLQEALGANNVDIEIVAYGPGIKMLELQSTSGNRIADAIKRGVKFSACEVTMRKAKLTKADMLDNIGYVPGGVVELMRRQQEGWAYIKP